VHSYCAISRTIQAASTREGSEGPTGTLWTHLLKMSELVIKLTIKSNLATCRQRREQADRIAAISTSSKRGHKEDPICQYFEWGDPTGSRKRRTATCEYCSHVMAWSVANVHTHTNGKNCKNWPKGSGHVPAGEIQFVPTISDGDDKDAARPRDSKAQKSPSSSMSANRAITPRWCDSMSKEEQARGELPIARAIHRTGEKFSVLDNPH
jgi:hypothetical protein